MGLFADMLYRPLFNAFGVQAELSLLPSGTTITAIDKTEGIAIPGTVEIETFRPCAELMVADVIAAGLTTDQLDDEAITLNGKTWRILSHRVKPTVFGDIDGKVYLILEGA